MSKFLVTGLLVLISSLALQTASAEVDEEGIPMPPAGFEDEVVTASDVYENPFLDTNIDSLEGQAAAGLYRRAIIGGYPDGEFKGEQEVNRAETAKFLLLALYGDIADVESNGEFPDVLDGEWYTKFVVTAAQRGIINGYPNGLFKPANTVNTVEFLKMLTLTFELEENMEYAYKDVDSTSWFAKYAGVAQFYNLFPYRNDYLWPSDYLTRNEITVALYALLGKYDSEEEVAEEVAEENYSAFAECIANKGVVLYSSPPCPYCINQKNMFASAFGYLNIVECDLYGGNPELPTCEELNITGVPTWDFPDGSRQMGAQSLERLAELTACPLPGEEDEAIEEESVEEDEESCGGCWGEDEMCDNYDYSNYEGTLVFIEEGEVVDFVYDSQRDKVYGIDANLGKMFIIDPNNIGVEGEVVVGDNPSSIILAGNKAYIANSGDKTISVIDLDSRAVVDEISLSIQPYDIIISGKYLYITHNSFIWGNGVVVDLDTNKEITTFGSRGEDGSLLLGETILKLHPNGTTLYVIEPRLPGRISKFTIADGGIELEEETDSDLLGEGAIRDLLLDSNGEKIYLTTADGPIMKKIIVLDAETFEILREIDIEGDDGPLFNLYEEGNLMLLGNYFRIVAYDLDTYSKVSTKDCNHCAGGSGSRNGNSGMAIIGEKGLVFSSTGSTSPCWPSIVVNEVEDVLE